MREFLEAINDYKSICFWIGVFIIALVAMILDFFKNNTKHE